MKHVLITGGAGFIGSHLAEKLISEQWKVTVIDNFDPFYDVAIKEENVGRLIEHPNYQLFVQDIRDIKKMRNNLSGNFDVIVHLAAKAGVRPSIENPIEYQDVNVCGTQNILELAKEWGIKQFVFASSSSVYGVNPDVPWSEENQVLMPISPYAATKISGELLGHVYSHLYGIRFIALRFFTVYGPRQRPDLAIHKFSKAIFSGEGITMYGDGSSCRDYTYIDDIVTGIKSAMQYQKSSYEVINLGNHETVSLKNLIQVIEKTIGRSANILPHPQQPGDVPRTFADISKAQKLLGYSPQTDINSGIDRFLKWFKLVNVVQK